MRRNVIGLGDETTSDGDKLRCKTMRQRWREEHARRYAYLTSQCMLGIKACIV